jgi:hypothetical protein
LTHQPFGSTTMGHHRLKRPCCCWSCTDSQLSRLALLCACPHGDGVGSMQHRVVHPARYGTASHGSSEHSAGSYVYATDCAARRAQTATLDRASARLGAPLTRPAGRSAGYRTSALA